MSVVVCTCGAALVDNGAVPGAPIAVFESIHETVGWSSGLVKPEAAQPPASSRAHGQQQRKCGIPLVDGGLADGMHDDRTDPHIAMDATGLSGTQPASAGSRRHPRGRSRWRVLAVIAAVAAVAGPIVLTQSSAGSDVRTLVPGTGQWIEAPAAPAGPLTERWSIPVPLDHELVGMVVDDDVVITASRVPQPGDVAGGVVEVRARAVTDGTSLWARSVPGADTLVALADATGVTRLLANVDPDRGATEQVAWGQAAVAVLDSADGGVRWRDPLDPQYSVVRVLADHGIVVEQRSGVTLRDALDGTVELSFPTAFRATFSTRAEVRARWSGSAWIVPTLTGWQIRDGEGRMEFDLDRPDAVPVVHDDLVVQVRGSTVTAHRRPGGQRAWEVDVGSEVLFTQRVDDPMPDDVGGAMTRVVAHVPTAPNDPLALAGTTARLIEDGRLVDASPGGPDALPDPAIVMEVEVDGGHRTVCLRPDEGVDTICPDDLALLGPSGEVLATASTDVDARTEANDAWHPTTAGLLHVDGRHVGLLRWDDLSQAWEIEVDGPRADAIQTSPRGVAVAIVNADTSSVSWFG